MHGNLITIISIIYMSNHMITIIIIIDIIINIMIIISLGRDAPIEQ